ncbi:MAG: protein translocase subunit SecF [Candidatus Krumholzibacteria bacterium]|nr:protein translocase subunit SecF [Candidatus Krumholzibacteria bacterium]
MEFFHKTNFNIIGFRYKAFIISGVIILAGLVSMVAKHGYKLSVEFKGGTLVQVKFDEPVPIANVRSSMARAGYANAEIQQYGEGGDEYIIKVGGVEEAGYASEHLLEGLNKVAPELKWKVLSAQQMAPDLSRGFEGGTLLVVAADSIPEIQAFTARMKESGYGILEATKETSTRAAFKIPLLGAESKVAEAFKAELARDFPDRAIEIRRTETIGPKVGKELQGRAWAAIIVSLFGILIYVSWRFELKFAVGAVIALAHDVLVTVGLFSIFNREISLFVVAALLTIVGYSINDTIVVYDRIRENFGLRRRESYEGMVNVSVNETLSRTIITVLTVFIVTMFLLFMGGEFVRDFALAMTIGLVTGTYSSVYVASAIVVEWQNRITNRRKTVRTAA